MKLGKLGKQLKKELAANPTKAGALVAVLAVAVYFWAPLLMPKKRAHEAVASPTPEVATVPGGPVAAAPTPSEGKEGDWKSLVEKRRSDVLTHSAGVSETMRDPFQDVALALAAKSEVEAPEAKTEPQVVAIEELDLYLDSIVYGSRTRTAVINGRAVSEGDEMELAAETNSNAVRLRIAAIGPNTVELESEGNRRTIELARSKVVHPITVIPRSER